MVFRDIAIGDDFYHEGDLYSKTSVDFAVPVSYRGGAVYFFWDEPVSLNPN